uniref:Uncharacterized protein n=1 Tax=Klebsiella pneumoniae TaxID=573 RepID=A0A8B0SXC5_KLEPN|nr:hypothetical protein [Klebsiella pneumoniae]
MAVKCTSEGCIKHLGITAISNIKCDFCSKPCLGFFLTSYHDRHRGNIFRNLGNRLFQFG